MITKKLLGLFFSIFGILLAVGLLALEWLGAGKFQGIGPLQRLALLGALAIFLVGISLVPLGDRPA
jgi:hypothetical protein